MYHIVWSSLDQKNIAALALYGYALTLGERANFQAKFTKIRALVEYYLHLRAKREEARLRLILHKEGSRERVLSGLGTNAIAHEFSWQVPCGDRVDTCSFTRSAILSILGISDGEAKAAEKNLCRKNELELAASAG